MDFFFGSSSGDTSSKGKDKGNLAWWQLSLIGIGCTIGTGYFLGSGIGIKITGPSMVFSFILRHMEHISFSLSCKNDLRGSTGRVILFLCE